MAGFDASPPPRNGGMILRSRAAFALLSITGLYALTLIAFFANMRISFPA